MVESKTPAHASHPLHAQHPANGEPGVSQGERAVVSFVRRGARMNLSQSRAWDAHHRQYVLSVPPGDRQTSLAPSAAIDLECAFAGSTGWPHSAPHEAGAVGASQLIVEIGSGNGDSLVPMAAARPNARVLAFEVYGPAVASTLGKLAAAGVDNVRLVMADGVQGLRQLLPPASVDELWLFFADPWHKKRHHKRRLVNPEFAALAVSRLKPGALWRLATDWDDYADAMRETLDASPGLRNLHPDGWAPRFAERPLTRFERRGLQAGRLVRDLTYQRVGTGDRIWPGHQGGAGT